MKRKKEEGGREGEREREREMTGSTMGMLCAQKKLYMSRVGFTYRDLPVRPHPSARVAHIRVRDFYRAACFMKVVGRVG